MISLSGLDPNERRAIGFGHLVPPPVNLSWTNINARAGVNNKCNTKIAFSTDLESGSDYDRSVWRSPTNGVALNVLASFRESKGTGSERA